MPKQGYFNHNPFSCHLHTIWIVAPFPDVQNKTITKHQIIGYASPLHQKTTISESPNQPNCQLNNQNCPKLICECNTKQENSNINQEPESESKKQEETVKNAEAEKLKILLEDKIKKLETENQNKQIFNNQFRLPEPDHCFRKIPSHKAKQVFTPKPTYQEQKQLQDQLLQYTRNRFKTEATKNSYRGNFEHQ